MECKNSSFHKEILIDCNHFFPKEIGAVLINVCSGTIEDQFQSYVRPTRCPKLSDFCVNLTGITQLVVDCHQTFSSVYRNFIAWIDQMKSEKGLRFASPTELRAADNGPNATFCLWSNWDLEHFFRIECQRAAIDIPSHFKTWVDVRMMFDVSICRRLNCENENRSKYISVV